MEKQLSVGYAKRKTTPDFPVGLGGYGGEKDRIWDKIVEDLYLTCIAVSNGEKTVLIYTVDSCNMPIRYQMRYRALISRETGVPEEHIFFGATHAHNASSIYFPQQADLLEKESVLAAKEALADCSEASLFAGKRAIPGMNFTRHYLTDRGERRSANMGLPKDAALVGHVTKSDPELTLIRFARKEKRDIVMINWQAHPDSAPAIGFTSVCPGWVGRLRDKLEEKTGVLAAYFTGTAGNQTIDSRIPEEKHGLQWFEYGEKMGEISAEVLAENMVPVSGCEIETERVLLPVEPNRGENHLAEKAKEVLQVRSREGVERAKAFCKEVGIDSVGHAKGILARVSPTIADHLELNVFSVGEIGFAVNTNETFSDQGLFIKENTPFTHTFLITANRGYLACREAYEYYAYEAVGGSAYYVPGTAEAMADCWLEMLGRIHEKASKKK